MHFHTFIRLHADRDDAIGDAANAIRRELDTGRGADDLEHELQEAAECQGTYQGLRELWQLWEARHGMPA
jgi:hypothetical protein